MGQSFGLKTKRCMHHRASLAITLAVVALYYGGTVLVQPSTNLFQAGHPGRSRPGEDFHGVFNKMRSSHSRLRRPPRVALCFFGLTRSLSVTRASLRRHVLDVLTSHGWAYDIFLHTYVKHTLTNPRSNEANVDLDTNEWRYLRPTGVLIEDSDKVDADYVKPLLPNILTRGDLWREHAVNHSSMANLLSQLRSIEKATGLLLRAQEKSLTTYDAVIFLRPDVWFFNDINMQEVETARAGPGVMFIPEFHAVAAAKEVNDRFAICHPADAKIWGQRRRLVDEYVFGRNETLHSERLLGYALRQANITVKPSTIFFGRVRANKVLWGRPGKETMVIKPMQMVSNALGGWRVC